LDASRNVFVYRSTFAKIVLVLTVGNLLQFYNCERTVHGRSQKNEPTFTHSSFESQRLILIIFGKQGR